MIGLTTLDSLFSDPAAVRLRREEAYLETQLGVRKKKSPYATTSKVKEKRRSEAGPTSLVLGEVPAEEVPPKPKEVPLKPDLAEHLAALRRDVEEREKRLRRRERDLQKREHDVVKREAAAYFQSDAARAATAAANAQSAAFRRLLKQQKTLPVVVEKTVPVVEAPAPAEKKKKRSLFGSPKKIPPVTTTKRVFRHTAAIVAAGKFLRKEHFTKETRCDLPMPVDVVTKLQESRCPVLRGVPRIQLSAPVRLLCFDFDLEFRADRTSTTSVDVADLNDDIFAAVLVLEESAGVSLGVDNIDPVEVAFVPTPQDARWTTIVLDPTTTTKTKGVTYIVPPGKPKERWAVAGVYFQRHRVHTEKKKTDRWNFGAVTAWLPGRTLGECVGQAARVLRTVRIQPYTLVEVEHCEKCHLHQETTKHVPGSYERRFAQVKKAIERGARHAVVVSNANGRPRIGAFEVRCLAYGETVPHLIHSKFGFLSFPEDSAILESIRCSTQRPPPNLGGQGRRRVTLRVLTDDDQRPAPGVVVDLFTARPGGCAFPAYDDEDFIEEEEEDDPEDDDDDDDDKEKVPKFRKQVSTRRKSSVASLAGGETASKLRSWNRRDVQGWLRTQCDLNDDEARRLAAKAHLDRGVDLLSVTEDHAAAAIPLVLRRRKVLEEVARLRKETEHPGTEEAALDDMDDFVRTWNLCGREHTGDDGSCTFDVGVSVPLIAVFDDPKYLPTSATVHDDHCTLVLQTRMVQVTVHTDDGLVDVVLVSRSRRLVHHRVPHGTTITVPADDYVLTATYTPYALLTDTIITVPTAAANRVSAFHNDLAARRIQSSHRRHSHTRSSIIDLSSLEALAAPPPPLPAPNALEVFEARPPPFSS